MGSPSRIDKSGRCSSVNVRRSSLISFNALSSIGDLLLIGSSDDADEQVD
jgi:hypothetical protein